MIAKTDRPPVWAAPLLALQFLTRIPVPGINALPAEMVRVGLRQAVGWFPLVGTLIGCITAFVVAGAGEYWPRIIAVALALIIEARMTGAFHEDAVADFCDAFGGGFTREDTLRIMKDSRVGSYGALGLILAVGLRAALMVSLEPALLVVSIIAAATFGRLLVVILMACTPPAAVSTGLAKDIGAQVGWRQWILALVLAAPGLALWCRDMPQSALFATCAGVAFLLWFRRLLIRRLGGSTGDCLGFSAYAGQLILLLAATIRCRSCLSATARLRSNGADDATDKAIPG